MIEAKASRTRERKETVFNEKKTVRDFGRSDAGQQLRHECDGGRICTGTVHGLRSGESNHHGHAGTDIPRRNWGISMASPPFWKVDGLKFKDLNGNGQLDVYEDWRQDVDARVKDLYD